MEAKEYLEQNSDWFDKSPGGEELYFKSEVIKMMQNYFSESSQTEISDKEIFKQSIKEMEEIYGSGCHEEIDAHFRGAIWYREQTKKAI